jgi:hypothetical protein
MILKDEEWVSGLNRRITMRKKPNIGSAKRERALAFILLDYAIDMSDLPGTVKTATGFPRDARQFWNQLLNRYHFLFSRQNEDRILKERRAPIVDDTWIKYHVCQRSYKGDTLIHHHVEQGPWAVGLPQKIHRDYYPEVHPWTNPDVLE